MPIPWSIVIALAVLGLAYIIKHFCSEVIEEENIFLMVVGVFLVVYVVAAIAVGSLNSLVFINGEAFAQTF